MSTGGNRVLEEKKPVNKFPYTGHFKPSLSLRYVGGTHSSNSINFNFKLNSEEVLRDER